MKLIDFHAHILPKADHGSNSIDVSLAQVKLAESVGISKIVATPHFYPHEHTLDDFVARRELAYDELAKRNDSSVEIIKAAEVLVCEGIENIKGLEKLCIGNSRAILAELPFSQFKSAYITSIKNMIYDGYKVILAHADRYDQRNIEELIYVGALIQLNASAFSTFLTKKVYTDWINQGLVVGIGSDIHMEDHVAYKQFTKAIKKIGTEAASNIMQSSQKIIDNQ